MIGNLPEKVKEWSYGCKNCAAVFPSESRLNQHLKSTHNQSNKFILQSHVKTVHGEEIASFQLHILQCSLKIPSLLGARKHYRSEHKDKPFTCNICKKDSVRKGHFTPI